MVDRYARDEAMLVYWTNTLYRLLNLIQNSGSENEVHQSLDQMEPVSVTAVLNANNDVKYVEPPQFATSESDEDLIVNTQEFTDALCHQLSKAYLNLCTRVVLLLKEKLLKAIFNPKQASSKSTDGGPEMRICLSTLSEIYQHFEQQKADKRVINHFFENLALCLDSVIFNQFIRDSISATKGLQVKMSVAFLENWFTSKGIIQTLRKTFEDGDEVIDDEKLQVTFTLSREAADICVIAQKQLLTDEGLRRMVCPELSLQQVAFIFSKFVPDEYTTSSSLAPREIEDIIGKKIPQVDSISSKPAIDFHFYTDLSAKKPNEGNVFAFELLDGHGKLNSLEIPERFTKLYADQLSFLQ